MVDFGLYSESGGRRVTIVDGTSWVGRYGPDGSLNIAASDGSGLYHACGAYNYTAAEDMTTFGRYAPDGSLYVSFTLGTFGLYAPNGALRVDTGIATPQQVLGSDLLGQVDWADVSTLTISNGRTSAIVDPIKSLTYSQAVSTARPLYDARGFAVFDGNDDELTAPDNPYGTGSTPVEFIAVVRQDRLTANTTFYSFFSAGTTNNTSRRISRLVQSGSSRFRASQGEGEAAVHATEDTVDFSGVHIVRGIFGATQIRAQIDAAISAATNTSPDTGAARSRIGASANATANNFAECSIAAILMTNSLTTEKWDALQPWLDAAKARFTA